MVVFQFYDNYVLLVIVCLPLVEHLNLCSYIRQINNIDFLSEVSTVHQFVYTDEALLLVRQ